MPKKPNIWIVRATFWAVVVWGVFTIYSYAGVIDLSMADFFLKNSPEKGREFSLGQELPWDETRLRIPVIRVDSSVVFPQSQKMADLKKDLDKGVVHYSYSALPEDPAGKVFLFGHSSARAYEEIPARTVFTELNRLKSKDLVEVWRQGRVYIYRVRSVRILASNEAEVYLASTERELTLSTCWPVGDPSNRFIVDAEFVRSYPQSQFQTGTVDTSS